MRVVCFGDTFSCYNTLILSLLFCYVYSTVDSSRSPWKYNSVGQSSRLITDLSHVRVLLLPFAHCCGHKKFLNFLKVKTLLVLNFSFFIMTPFFINWCSSILSLLFKHHDPYHGANFLI